jgi:hypothetical protein
MIQRIQSIYLLMTTLLSVFFLRGEVIKFSEKAGSIIEITFNGLVRNPDGQSGELINSLLPFSVIIVLIPLVSLITLFCFKNRKLQLSLALSVIILTSALIIVSFYYTWKVYREYEVCIEPGLKAILLFLLLIFAILAYRGILKDDRLVKSYDRIR